MPRAASKKTIFRDRRLGARPPLERMLQIHRAIQAGEYPNATTLAKSLEVSSKSIQRDIDFMRDRLALPLEYHPLRYGYFYTEEVRAFPSFQVTEGELFALLAAEKALQQYRGTPFERPLVSAFRKISESLPDTVSINWADWDSTLSFRTTAEPLVDLAVLDRLSRAASKRRQLAIDYRKPGSKEVQQRIVDPYHIANVNGEWFLFAYCHLRKGIRTFAPIRMSQVRETGVIFRKNPTFSIEHELRNSFGIHSGTQSHVVRIRFAESVADYIREKRWHPSQKLKELSDGGVELTMKLSGLAEIQRWILGWGGKAVVLAPAELSNAIREAAKLLLESAAT